VQAGVDAAPMTLLTLCGMLIELSLHAPTACVSALVTWNTTQMIMFKSSSTPAEVRVLSVSICPHTDDDDDDKTTHISAAHGVSMRDD